MQYFNFSRIIKKYSTTFTAKIPTKGAYNELGDYVAGEPQTVELTGAIISHRQSKVFRSEGVLTQQDRALYMLEPLNSALQGALIRHKGKVYRVSNELENGEFTGIYAYTLQYQSAFDEKEGNE